MSQSRESRTVKENRSKAENRSAHNASLHATAESRLAELVTDAETDRMTGVVAIEVYFEAGRIDSIRRRIDGRDRL